MTKENLQKAIDLQKFIETKKAHLEEIVTGRGDKEVLRFEFSNRNAATRLNPKYLPISCQNFIDIYVLNLKAHIKELENEFELM